MIDQTTLFACLQQNTTQYIHQTDNLLVETPLQIYINFKEFSITMQTPGAERYLVRGLLHAEGFENSVFLSYYQIEESNGTVVSVEIHCEQPISDSRQLSATSSCGMCGKKNLDHFFDFIKPIHVDYKINAKQITANYTVIEKYQALFSKTGGCHAASALDAEGNVLCVFEDIGRHNAVDKVIGYLLETQQLQQARVLTVSGRISFEIVQKCVRANIPVLTSISAPSSLAVEMAKKANLTLAAFCRGDRATFYSGFERVEEN